MIDFATWINTFDNESAFVELLCDSIAAGRIFTSENDLRRLEFEETYKRYLPMELQTFCYGVSGSEAVEHALVIAEHKKEKTKFLYFDRCYHGSSICLLNVSYPDSKRDSDYTFDALPHPIEYDGDDGMYLKDFFDNLPCNHNYAGVIVDPSFGNVVYDPGKKFFKTLRKCCSDNDLLLIFDEVRTGLGRTGELFAFVKYDIIPDILCISKAIANGLPLSVTIYDGKNIKKQDKEKLHYRLETTFAGHDLALLSAIYTIDKVSELIDSIRGTIERASKRLNELLRYGFIKEIRSQGMIFGIDFVNSSTNEPSPLLALKFANKVNKLGVRVNYPDFATIVIHPGLCLSERDLEQAIKVFHNVCESI